MLIVELIGLLATLEAVAANKARVERCMLDED